MSPDDVRTVLVSWPTCRSRRATLLPSLAVHLSALAPSPIDAAARAEWLFRAVEELVRLLPEPSRLEARARAFADTWPDRLVAPSYAVDGRSWMLAACATVPSWSPTVECAWRQAWFLLSEVLATEALSPFAAGPAASPPPC